MNPLQDRFVQQMKKNGLKALIVASPENVVYAAGVYIVSQRMIRERLLFTVYPLVGEPFAVVSSVVEATVRRKSWIKELHVYTEHKVAPVDKLLEVLRSKNLTEGRIGVETGFLAARYYSELTSGLPRVEFIDCEALLSQLRLAKAPHEIEFLRTVTRRAEKAIMQAYMLARPGDTEKSVAQRMVEGHTKLGADNVPFLTFAAGPENTMHPHAEPGDQKLEPGAIMRVDIVGFFQGYYTDLARMAVVGSPSPQVKKAYSELLAVQRGVIGFLRPGVSVPAVYERAVELMRAQGRELHMDAIGHSVGVFLHEYPNLEPGCEDALPENAVVNIEISFDVEGLGGFHIEDTLLVTANKAVYLSDQTDTSEIYIIG